MIPVYKIIFSLILGLIYFIKTARANTAVWVSLGVLGTALITGSWNTSYFVSTKCPAWYGLEAIANAPGDPAWTNWGCFGAVMGVAIERALGAGCLAVSGKHGFQTVDTIVDVDDAGDLLRKRSNDPSGLSTHYVANLTTSLIVSGPDYADLTSLIGTSYRANQKRETDSMTLTSAGHLVPQNLTMTIDGVLHLPANYTSYPYGMTYDLNNGHSLIIEALHSDPVTIHNQVIQGPANETSLHKRFGEVDWVSLEAAAVTAGVCDWEVIGWDFAAAGNLDFWTALAEATGEELDGTIVFPAKKCVSLWTSRDSPRDDLLEAEMYINTWGGFDGDCVVGSQG